MKFVFSKHALEQMELRNISKQTAEDVLQNPQEIIRKDGTEIYQSVMEHSGRKYLIRIFVSTKQRPPLIITVYKTSKISKYHEGKI